MPRASKRFCLKSCRGSNYSLGYITVYSLFKDFWKLWVLSLTVLNPPRMIQVSSTAVALDYEWVTSIQISGNLGPAFRYPTAGTEMILESSVRRGVKKREAFTSAIYGLFKATPSPLNNSPCTQRVHMPDY